MANDIEERRTTMFVAPRTRFVAVGACSTSCGTCKAPMADDARFCGMCGKRVRQERQSRTGSRIDCYEVHEMIAEGGFATVYRARAIPSGEEVALKVLHDDLADDPLIVERFRREARCLVRLSDRHTVVAFDFGSTDGVHWLAMELLHGATLRTWLRECGPMPWRRVLSIMRAVCSSLAEAHEHGMVHRDVKPSNIFLGDDGVVRLIDFGLVKRVGNDESDLTREGQAVGTLQYMSPEQMFDARCDGRSDVWSLGVVAYEMITGHRPFEHAKTADAIVAALVTGHVRPASLIVSRRSLPPEVDRLLLWCLATDPAQRFANIAELTAEIDRILAIPSGMPRPRMLAEGTGTRVEPAPTQRVHSWLMWMLLFLAGGAGLGTAVARLV